MEPVFFILKIFENFENTFHFFKINFFCKNSFFLYIVLLFFFLCLWCRLRIFIPKIEDFFSIFSYIFIVGRYKEISLYSLYISREKYRWIVFILPLHLCCYPHKTSYSPVLTCTNVLTCPHMYSLVHTCTHPSSHVLTCPHLHLAILTRNHLYLAVLTCPHL